MLFVRIFRMATDESPDATEENPAAAPATPKNNHRPGSLLLDMDTAERVWMKPMGNGARFRNLPLLRDLDLPPLGGDSTRAGPLLTKTLLVYALTTGGTNDGPRLVALDKMTGDELASVDLPGGAIGAPMTYKVDDRQYIAVTVGGSRVPELIALALP